MGAVWQSDSTMVKIIRSEIMVALWMVLLLEYVIFSPFFYW